MRLFAGIALDDPTRAACAAITSRLEATGFAARYIPPENYHITLAFLGNIGSERFESVARTVEETAAEVTPLALTLDRLGAFPHERHPRVIYVGARDQGAAFRNLALDLRARYEKMGFTFNDDAVAHVTIARVKGGSKRPLPLLELAPITVDLCKLSLFESISEKGATRYVALHCAELLARIP